MAENLGNLFECRATVNHFRGETVPERMDTVMLESRTPEEIAHSAVDVMMDTLFRERRASGSEHPRGVFR